MISYLSTRNLLSRSFRNGLLLLLFYLGFGFGLVPAQSAGGFTNIFFVNSSAEANGSVYPARFPITLRGSASFQLTPERGYRIGEVGGTCGGTLLGNVFKTTEITASCTVIARFSPAPADSLYIATDVLPSGVGQVFCSPNPVVRGTDSTCSVLGSSAYSSYPYYFKSFSGDCSGTAAQCTLTNIQQPQTVTGNFSTIPWLPSAPQNVVASRFDDMVPGGVALSFTTPGVPFTAVDYFTVTSIPGNQDFFCNSSPCGVTVNNDGSSYRFTVTGHNAAGSGPTSDPSNSVTPKLSQSIAQLNFSANSVEVSRTVTAAAAATSGLPVTLTSLTPDTCTVSGQTITGLAFGFCDIQANQAGNESYLSAYRNSSLRVSPLPPINVRLVNLSTRSRVEIGAKVMIGGFVVGGTSPKTVLVRAIGPSLTAFGVSDALANPSLTLYAGQTVIASNDNWATADNVTAISASGLAPQNNLESAILMTLSPGAYTAMVEGVGVTSGVGLVEVFELDHPEIPLLNISTRGPVRQGDSVMIGGFVVQGDVPQTVLISARGPSLANQGVADVLADPVLALYSGPTLIASNDNWGTASNAFVIAAKGNAPPYASESAILMTLQPGAYTAVVSGAEGGTGVAIVEVVAQ